jgi:hypothetical protein
MKTVFSGISAAAVAAVVVASPALAMPWLATPTVTEAATPSIEKARVVCNWRRCYHVGYYRYYRRPYYGYYHPYYYAPHIGVGIGPFGVRVF